MPAARSGKWVRRCDAPTAPEHRHAAIRMPAVPTAATGVERTRQRFERKLRGGPIVGHDEHARHVPQPARRRLVEQHTRSIGRPERPVSERREPSRWSAQRGHHEQATRRHAPSERRSGSRRETSSASSPAPDRQSAGSAARPQPAGC